MDSERLPDHWVVAAAGIAATIPEIRRVHMYGSRVTGWSRHDRPWSSTSDLDIALEFDGADDNERVGNAICLAPRFENALAAALNHVVKLHVETVGYDDQIVGPAVRDQGRLIYQR